MSPYTTVGKQTTPGKVMKTWYLSGDGGEDPSPGVLEVQFGHRRQKPQGIGVARLPVQFRGRRLLHQDAGIHDGHPLGDVGHHPQVVGDEEHCQIHFSLEAGQKGQYLGLDGDIQSGGGFVGNKELRVKGQGHGDEDPLTQPPGKLVGISVQVPLRIRQTYAAESLGGLDSRLPMGQVTMLPKDFSHLFPHGKHRIESGHGLLKDHADPVAPDPPHGFGGKGHEVLPGKKDLPLYL
jgi:hypothetical protein